MSPLTIAIVGCGPAGLALGLGLAKTDHQVILLERFEEPHPVGSGLILQPTGQAVLKRLLPDVCFEEPGARIDRMTGISVPGQRIVLDVNYKALGSQHYGIGVHRATLFERLYKQCVADKVTMETSCDICELYHGKKIYLVDVMGKRYGPFDLVVDASGRNSALTKYAMTPPRIKELHWGALWTTLKWAGHSLFRGNALEQRYKNASIMIGVLPIGTIPKTLGEHLAFFWSLPVHTYDGWLGNGLSHWKEQVFGIWPETEVLLEQITDPRQMSLASYSHHTLRSPFGKGIIFIGDSAHATSPQLGQGANMALLDVLALMQALTHSKTVDDIATQYTQMRRSHVRLFQLASLAFTPFYQSNSRALSLVRDWFFDPVSRLPVAAHLVASLISGTLGKPFQKMGLDR